MLKISYLLFATLAISGGLALAMTVSAETPTCGNNQYWNGSECVYYPVSISYLNFVPKVTWAIYNPSLGTLEGLASHFSKARFVCSTKSESLTDNYGYRIDSGDDPVTGSDVKTYHGVKAPSWMTGTWYCRFVFNVNGQDYYSSEFIVNR